MVLSMYMLCCLRKNHTNIYFTKLEIGDLFPNSYFDDNEIHNPPLVLISPILDLLFMNDDS